MLKLVSNVLCVQDTREDDFTAFDDVFSESKRLLAKSRHPEEDVFYLSDRLISFV